MSYYSKLEFIEASLLGGEYFYLHNRRYKYTSDFSRVLLKLSKLRIIYGFKCDGKYRLDILTYARGRTNDY